MTREESVAAVKERMRLRQLARTDLVVLAKLLCYGGKQPIKGMRRVWEPIFSTMQQFKGGTDYYEVAHDGKQSFKGYVPECDMWDLQGSRNTMVLVPRNHLKSTFLTIAHSIQWIINYPNIRIRLVAAKNDQVIGFLREMKEHFVSNQNFRKLFPEFCPSFNKSGKLEDFGTNEFFTVPCRTANSKEPTVSILSEGSVVSSTHFDVLKVDDLVDIENSKTAERIASINLFFDALMPLIERSLKNPDERGWLDVIGTRYSHSDLYGKIIERERESEKKTWSVTVKSAEVDPDTETAFWPERMSWKALQAERAQSSSFMYSSQYLQNPISEGQGLVHSEEALRFERRDLLAIVRNQLREYVTVDMASLEDVKHSRSDYTAILHGGWDNQGQLHIIDIRHGRFTESQFMDNLFDLARNNPKIITFKFQKDLISSTFMPVLQREMTKRMTWFETDWVSVAGRNKLADRIQHLEPLYRNRHIIYYDPISPVLNEQGNRLLKIRLVDEILKFPYFAHDDILDAQSDFLMHRNEVGTDSIPEMPTNFSQLEYGPRVLRFGHDNAPSPVIPKSFMEQRIFGTEEEDTWMTRS